MIQKYETFGKCELKYGDRVVVKYKASKYFMLTGEVISVNTTGPYTGDCRVRLDYSKDGVVEFYYTNLERIVEIIVVPSGESLSVPYKAAGEFAIAGIIGYNKVKDFYYVQEEDMWQIESLAI